MMKDKIDMMMSTMRGWVATSLDDLVHRTDSPFIVEITSCPLPPQLETYDWSKDPLDHLESFKTLMHL